MPDLRRPLCEVVRELQFSGLALLCILRIPSLQMVGILVITMKELLSV